MVTKTKKYKDTTGEERVASAEKMKKEEYSPMDTLRKLVSPKQEPVPPTPPAGLPKEMKKGGAVKSPKNKSASSRADGIAVRGKTRA
jgi:hypothetical protein